MRDAMGQGSKLTSQKGNMRVVVRLRRARFRRVNGRPRWTRGQTALYGCQAVLQILQGVMKRNLTRSEKALHAELGKPPRTKPLDRASDDPAERESRQQLLNVLNRFLNTAAGNDNTTPSGDEYRTRSLMRAARRAVCQTAAGCQPTLQSRPPKTKPPEPEGPGGRSI